MVRKAANPLQPSSEKGLSAGPSRPPASRNETSLQPDRFSSTITDSSDDEVVQEDVHEPPSDTNGRVPEPTGPGQQPIPHDADHTGDLTNCTRLIINGQVLYIAGNRTVYVDTGRYGSTVHITDYADFPAESSLSVCTRCNGYGKQPLLHQTGGSTLRSQTVCADCEGLGAIFPEDHERHVLDSRPRHEYHSAYAQAQDKTLQGQGTHLHQSLTNESERTARRSNAPRAVSTYGELQTAATRGHEEVEGPGAFTARANTATPSRRVGPVASTPIGNSSSRSRKSAHPRSDAVPESRNAQHTADPAAKKGAARGAGAVHPDPMRNSPSSVDARATASSDVPSPQSPYHTDRYLRAVRDHERQVSETIPSRQAQNESRHQKSDSQAEADSIASGTGRSKYSRRARPARLSLREMNRSGERERLAKATDVGNVDGDAGKPITKPVRKDARENDG